MAVYLLVLLEFQSTVEPAMATRMLTYTGMLYEKLIDDGVLREHGKLPPVLPIVICNGFASRATASRGRLGFLDRVTPVPAQASVSATACATICLTTGGWERTICRVATWCRR